jgi:hypothetical protein
MIAVGATHSAGSGPVSGLRSFRIRIGRDEACAFGTPKIGAEQHRRGAVFVILKM